MPPPAVVRALTRTWRAGRPVALGTTLAPLRRGPGDPTMHVGPGGLWRTTRTPDGPATLHLAVSGGVDGSTVHATAWGAGADRVLDSVPALLGADDDVDGFVPYHPVVRETWRRHLGWRVPRTGQVFEALVPAVLEQKVTGAQAWRAWRTLVTTYGDPAPGPSGAMPPRMRVAPAPEVWRRIPSWAWHRAGVDLSRSRTVVTAAGAAGRLEALTGLEHAAAAARLRSLPGVGAWTVAEVAQRALGDPDAVSVGDFHLAKLVGTALIGRRVDDEQMLELLAPYAGHRYRAVRMIELSGIGYERHGPRYAGADYRAM